MKIKKWNNEIANETNDFATLMALPIDEIHIQPRYLFHSKNCVFRPSHDDSRKIAKSVLVLLLPTLTGKTFSINLASKPVHNLKTDYLKDVFLNSLEKSIECGYKIFLIVLDGASTSVKFVKTTNKVLNPTTNDKPTPAAQL